MAWNRPKEREEGTGKREEGARKSPFRGLVAGLIVVGAAVAAWWLLSDSTPPPSTSTSTSTSLIREAKPAAAKRGETPRRQEAAKPKKVDPNARPTSPGQYLNGYRMLANGRLHKVEGILTNSTRRTSLADRAFTEESDLAIGYLLMVRPGEPLLGGGSEYYQTFEADFLESLKTPIVIGEDDDDDAKAIKQDVIDIRKELKARHDRGEDLVKIMRETRDQLQELAVYRQDIEKMVIEKGIDVDNQRDYDDLISAANLMLQERGVEPLVMPAAFKSAVREWRREARTEQEDVKKGAIR